MPLFRCGVVNSALNLGVLDTPGSSSYSYAQGTSYHGRLQSPKAACPSGRTVTLYGKRTGKPDRAESHGTSKADGSWYVPLPLEDASDDTAIYFEVSAAKPQGASFTCQGDRTPDIAIGGN